MEAVQDIDIRADAALIVAWRSGHSAHAAVVKAGGDVIDALRGHAQESLNIIASGLGRPYNPDDEQDEDSPVLTANQDELLDTALLEQLHRGPSCGRSGQMSFASGRWRCTGCLSGMIRTLASCSCAREIRSAWSPRAW